MIQLTATNHIIELVTSSTSAIDWSTAYVDITTTATTPDSSQGTVSSATTTTIVSAPAASTTRVIKTITINNRGTADQTITIKKDIAGTEYVIFKSLVRFSESLQFLDTKGWVRLDASGEEISAMADRELKMQPRMVQYYKTGTTPETTEYWYCFAKDGVFPGV